MYHLEHFQGLEIRNIKVATEFKAIIVLVHIYQDNGKKYFTQVDKYNSALEKSLTTSVKRTEDDALSEARNFLNLTCV